MSRTSLALAATALSLTAALAPVAPSSAADVVVGPSVMVQVVPPSSTTWWTSPVVAGVTATSLTSTVSTLECPGAQVADVTGLGTSTAGGTVVVTAQGSVTFWCKATSADGGLGFFDLVTLRVETVPPMLSPAVTPQPLLLGSTASALPNASDATSGVASAACGAVSTVALGLGQV